jgi:zinc-binding alcohol dehydrogenase family protein
MRAFIARAFNQTASAAVEAATVPVPSPQGFDLLVKNRAVATNPVDVKKLRNYGRGEGKLDAPLIAGWDAAGVVEAVGPDVCHLKPGDEVYYAGSVSRPGCFAEYTLVDERIVGRKPRNLSWEQAATVPLCALTAWEGLVEQMRIPLPASEDQRKANAAKTLLVIGGAGGVGSICVQIAKRVLNLHVIATASRPETVKFAQEQGADAVIDHSQPFMPQLEKLGLKGADLIYCTVELDLYWEQIVPLLNPLGTVCAVVGSDWSKINLGQLVARRGTLTCELMFTRPLFDAAPERQREVLDEVARLLEAGVLRHTLVTHMPFSLAGLRQALDLQQSGKAIGKIALSLADSH